MATSTVLQSTLVLSFDNGVDAKGKPVVKRKAFRNIKTAATQDQLYNVASVLAPLQQLPLISVERDDAAQITMP